MSQPNGSPESTYYVIGIGGSGSKVMESMTYAAALDLFTHPGGEGDEDAIIDKIEMLSLDVDASCGNTDRMHDALIHYRALHGLYAGRSGAHRGFNTELSRKAWTTDAAQTAGVEALVYNSPGEQLLAHAIYSDGESHLAYDKGFHGHPNLGVLFFRYHLDQLAHKEAEGKDDEINQTLALLRRDLEAGKVVRVLIAGSIFGGTGASGIPQVARFLRDRLADTPGQQDRLLIGGIFLLPFYHVPGAPQNEHELTIDSFDFMEKAGTALKHYGDNNAIRNGGVESVARRNGLFDAIYLLGLPKDEFLFARRYASGAKEQLNEAHLLEWLATCCSAHFYYTDFLTEDHRDCYHYEIHTDRFDWSCFFADSVRFRRAYTGLMHAAALFVGELYPTLKRGLSSRMVTAPFINYWTPYFLDVQGRAPLCEEALDHLFGFLKYYVLWMCQVLRTMPPKLRSHTAEERKLSKTASAYRELLYADASDEQILGRLKKTPPFRRRIVCQLEADELGRRLVACKQAHAEAEANLRASERSIVAVSAEGLEKLGLALKSTDAARCRAEALDARNRQVLEGLLAAASPDDSLDVPGKLPGNDLFEARWLAALEALYLNTSTENAARRRRPGRVGQVLRRVDKREEILMRISRPKERLERKASAERRVAAFLQGLIYRIGSEVGT